MKKGIAILLTLIMSLTLVGCQGNDDVVADSAADSTPVVKRRCNK